ncbi:MAG: TIM barrel protein [Promethearchaeota archaeon]
MDVGISSMFFGDITIGELASIVEGTEVTSCMDIWYDTPFHLLEDARFRRQVIDAINAMRESGGLRIASHASNVDLNPIAYHPGIQQLVIGEVKESLRFASKIHSECVTIHGGFNTFGKKFTRFDMKLLEKLLDELLEFKAQQGMDMLLSIENDTATANMTRPLESKLYMENVLSRFPELQVTLDVAHVLKSSLDAGSRVIRETRLDVESLHSFLDEYGSRVKIVHVSSPDSSGTHGRIDMTPGSTFSTIMDLVTSKIRSSDAMFIFEYNLESVQGLGAGLPALLSDMSLFKEKYGGTDA